MKYIDAEKLIAELRRQKHELELSIQSQGDYGQSCHIIAYENIISLIDSLHEEPDNDLEEAAERFAVSYDQGTCDGIAQECFKAGAEWQAKRSPLPEDTLIFRKGVEEGKRLMMEEAVDAHVVQSFNPCTEELKPTLHGVMLLYEDEGKPYLVAGDDTRIIILPTEDKK